MRHGASWRASWRVMARHGGRHGASWRLRVFWKLNFLTFLDKFLEKPSKTAKITKNLEFPAISFENGKMRENRTKTKKTSELQHNWRVLSPPRKNGQTRFSRHFGSRSRLKSQSAEAPTSGRSGQMASVSAKQVSASQVVASAADIHPQ